MTAPPRAGRSSVKRVSAERTGSARRSSVLRVGMNRSLPLWGDRKAKAKANRRDDADHQPTDPQPAGHATRKEEGAGAAAEPAEARRVHSGLHQHAEEAELGLAQGCQGA